MLASRCTAWVRIGPLPPDQVPSAARGLHPVWHRAPDTLLHQADARFAHGRLRAWAALTHHTRRALRSRPAPVTGELLERIACRLGPVPR
ncbi:hypothetical protein [Streptomyces sp. NBC_00212]|uniref:hypothetical protein n=1 Tax=Streptomyces sp. NBC_00212 TaxID=2975684 RepID=UPI003245A32E